MGPRLLTMSTRELDRCEHMRRIQERRLPQLETARLLGLNGRQVERLYERYGFVIAKRHADSLGLRLDLSDFNANDFRLRLRLANLGLLRILSDDCAFVLNRYSEEA